MNELTRLRLAKLAYGLGRPACWPALARGVAPSIEHRTILRGLTPDLILDVGANRGQFTLLMRQLHPGRPIHAFEPLPDEAAVFRAVHGGQPGIVLHELALGDQPGSAELHVSARADSSSLLPIGEQQVRLFPDTHEVRRHRVQVTTLDELSAQWGASSRALLKLDVQGFELNVLRGARRALTHCAYVYAECSEVPLYAGQALRGEVETFLREAGFRRAGWTNASYHGDQLVQADYLFAREATPA